MTERAIPGEGSVLVSADKDLAAGRRYRFKHLSMPIVMRDMSFNEDDPGPGLLMRLLFGRVARKREDADDASVIKLAVKCDLCRNLAPMRDGSARAACVASCPTGAIVRVNPRDYVDELIERA